MPTRPRHRNSEQIRIYVTEGSKVSLGRRGVSNDLKPGELLD